MFVIVSGRVVACFPSPIQSGNYAQAQSSDCTIRNTVVMLTGDSETTARAVAASGA